MVSTVLRGAMPALLLGMAFHPAAAVACPVGTTVTVDNDLPGTGYSEEKPENWVQHNVDACQGTYRYLSHTVGDGTRKDRATWKPTITIPGYYEVTTSFRATENRTNDADYVLHDDQGGTQHKVVNQQLGNGCTKVVIGTAYCVPSGACRLVLDGTDDGQSDSTDATTFELVSCDAADAGSPSACADIANNPSYELCEATPTSCAGVFTDGSGCTQFCAAAGMDCVARFGGEPGCQKEPQNPIPCGANNGHGSDYCECAAPSTPMPDAGGSGAAGTSGNGGSAGTLGFGGGGATLATGGSDAGATPRGESLTDDEAGCGCRAPASPSSPVALSALLLGLLGLLRLRRRR